MSAVLTKGPGHPKPRCHFGRQHSWSVFVYMADHFACSVCGVEDDAAWWEGTTYFGPVEPRFVDVSQGGWALRRDVEVRDGR